MYICICIWTVGWRLPCCAEARSRMVARARLRVIQPMLRQAGN